LALYDCLSSRRDLDFGDLLAATRHEQSLQGCVTPMSVAAKASAEILPLTSIRGVAAIWVMLGHMLPDVLRALDITQAPRLLTNFAHGNQFSVDIFFILSGYIMVVAYGLHANPLEFYLNRVARVYPLHIVALGATIAGFFLLQVIPPKPEAYSLGNLVFYFSLTSVWVGLPPAWNLPAWSLSVEIFAYIFFPIVQWAARDLNRASVLAWVFVLCGAHTIVLATMGFVDTGIGALLRGVFGFCAGAFLRAASIRSLQLAPAISLAAILFAAVFNLYEYAIPAILLLIGGLGINQRGLLTRIMSSQVLVWLGKISYSIYLIHLPLLMGSGRFLRKIDVLQSPSGQTIFCLCYIAAVLVVAHLSWRFIETPARIAVHSWYLRYCLRK
jgi:peptidoglycan/LPS O-acetylase OafA/YrhL